jgi:hypothetical protein
LYQNDIFLKKKTIFKISASERSKIYKKQFSKKSFLNFLETRVDSHFQTASPGQLGP